MKVLKRLSFMIALAFVMIGSVVPINADHYVDEKFIVEDFNLTVDVNKDGTYDVKEEYLLNFHESSIGIYRNIESDYKMQWEVDGVTETKRYYFPVTDVNVTSNHQPEEFYVDEQSEGVQIVIGGDDYATDSFIGEKRYEITYKLHTTAIDNGVDKEALFYNILPKDWGTHFLNVNATINFHDTIDSSKAIVRDCYGNTENFIVEGNDKQLTVTNQKTIPMYCGITAYLPLSEDFFAYENVREPYINTLVILGAPLIALLLIYFLYTRYGRGPVVIENVTFKPPQGLNSAMVGFVNKDQVDDKAIYSLLFEWANKNYITIEERDDKSKLVFKKVNDIDSDAPHFERQLFEQLFYTDEEITIKDWKKGKVFNGIQVAKSRVAREPEVKNIYDKKSIFAQVISGVILASALAVSTLTAFQGMYYRTVSSGLTAGIILLSFVSIILLNIAYIFLREVFKKKRVSKYFITVMAFVIVIVIYNAVLDGSAGSMLTPISALIGLGVPLIITASTVIIHAILSYTEHGSRLKGDVLGLETFIKVAKEDELKMMQEENPSLYYDVLPYAYVFGLSSLWINHFKNLEIPPSPNYVTYRMTPYYHYSMMNSMVRNMNQINTQIMPKVSTGTGGGSFSSFGGGGASFSGGGGFGGGGGGSR